MCMKVTKTIRGTLKGKTLTINPVSVEVETKSNLGKTKGKFKGMSESTALAICQDKASGATVPALSEKYAVSISMIEDALQGVFIKSDKARALLKKVFAENSLACAMHTRARITDLSPMQAAVASGIFASKLIDLEKADEKKPSDMDSETVKEALNDLKALRKQLES